DITERKRMEAALQENITRYRALFENINNGVAVYEVRGDGEDFIFKDFNRAGEKIDNDHRERLIGRSIFDVRPGVKQFGLIEVFRKVWQTGEPAYHPVMLYQDDRLTGWYENYIYKLPSGEIVTIFENITERKKADEALRRSEERFRGIVKNAPFGYYRVGKDGLWQYVNPVWERMHGLSLKDVIEKPFEITQPEDSVEQARELVKRALAGETIVGEFCRLKRDGNVEYHSFTIQPVKYGKEIVAIEGFINDITEHKRVEEILKINEIMLTEAMKLARLGAWEYDVASDQFTFNDQFYSLLHTTAEQEGGYIMSSAHYAQKFVHPKEMTLVGLETQKAIETIDPNYYNQLDHRIVCADGEVRYITVHIRIRKDAQGRTVKTYGVNQDITERKQSEENIKKALAEKEVLLREIHHRVKNNLTIITSLLNLQSNRITNKEQALAAFEDSRNRIYSMALVHEQLYKSNDFSNIKMKPFIETLSIELKQANASEKDITLDLVGDNVVLGVSLAIPCGLILNELISNAYKHAFPGRKTGHIKISLRLVEAKSYELSVQDNGVGLPEEVDIENSETLGLLLVDILTKQIDGKLEIRREKGTTFIIRFKI
ncbi:MAG: PAS domain S-box protein, partial [Candidatus Aminicenantes bacterium]|nr:PAS domain S-box protein [Candidatus Aminicenantes bacterium]